MRISDWSSDVCSSDLSDSAAAFLANSQGPAWMAEATGNAKIPLIHLSTDYVFDGRKTTAYSQDDETVPLGFYGASQRARGLAVIRGNPQSIVLRTPQSEERRDGQVCDSKLRNLGCASIEQKK